MRNNLEYMTQQLSHSLCLLVLRENLGPDLEPDLIQWPRQIFPKASSSSDHIRSVPGKLSLGFCRVNYFLSLANKVYELDYIPLESRVGDDGRSVGRPADEFDDNSSRL